MTPETYTRDSDGKKFEITNVDGMQFRGELLYTVEYRLSSPIPIPEPMPTWKPLSWALDYEVSIQGEVRKKTETGYKMIAPYIKTYPTIYISNESQKGKMYLVHRLVWETFKGSIPEGYQIDHIDREKTNNNLNNLRLATVRENRCNQIPARFPKSGYRGVYPNYNRFQAMIRDQTGKRVHLGSFKTAKEAAIAYNAAAIIMHGEFAVLNQIETLGG